MAGKFNYCKGCRAFWPSMAGLLTLAIGAATFGADAATPAKDVIMQLMSAIKTTDAEAAKRCYATTTPEVTDAINAFIAERMALRTLITLLDKRFPDQSADLEKSRLAPFIDQALDKECDTWHAGTEKPLRDGSILVKAGKGSTAVVRKTDDGWRIEFTSMMNGRVSRDNANADHDFISQEREQTALCDDIAAKIRRGDYKSLLEATHAYDTQLDAIVFAHRPSPDDASSQPKTTRPADPVVSWSVAGSYVALCARDGSVKAWNVETGEVAARFSESLNAPRAEGGIACGPDTAFVGLLDPKDSKSLRVLDGSGKTLAVFSDFQGVEQLPNGLIQRIIGIMPDGSTMITAQNNDDYVGCFDLRAKRVTSVIELPKQPAGPQFSVVIALRDASAFVHFQGSEAIGYDFQGHIRWREPLPNVTAPAENVPYARWRPAADKSVFHPPHLQDVPMVTDATAFWVATDRQPTRLELRTGAMSPMRFAGSMREIVTIDADHGYIVTRDPDDDSYWLWDGQGRKCMIGDLAGSQRLAFSPNGTHLLALADPAACAVNHSVDFTLIDAIQVFRIGDGKCEKTTELR